MMLLLLLALLLPQGSPPEAEQEVVSHIQEVTVFQRGAQVTRLAGTVVPAGTTALVFADLTPQLDPESIQLRADGDFMVLSVVHRHAYREDAGPATEVERLQARKAALQDSLAAEQMLLQVYQQEEALLLENKSIGSTATGVQVAELASAADFFRTRLTEIKMRQLALTNRIAQIQQQIRAIDAQLGQVDPSRNRRHTSEVVITVASEARTRGRFALSYLTPAAGWHPHYELRVQDVNRPMALAYRANISQHTGEDWKQVALTLSTGDPARPGTRPELRPWRLGFLTEPAVSLDEVVVTGAPAGRVDVVEREAASLPVPVRQIEQATTVAFRIDVPYTIPSDGKPHTVAVETYTVPAAYAYYAAPKASPSAFLTAYITGWEDLNLLGGEANLFFEDTYVGRSLIDPASVQDTLAVSLGRDERIVVRRTRIEAFSDRRFFSQKRTETFAFEIEVRNNKPAPVEILIEDQVPVSTNDQIEVRSEAEGAEVNAETGMLQWRLRVPPAATRSVTFRYTVTYPRGKQVLLG